jgi:hypothetical protein
MDDLGPRSSSSRTRHRTNPSTGWAYAGSQRHVQAYTNAAALVETLNTATREVFPTLSDTEIEWRAPLAENNYEEPRDDTFWTAIKRPDLKAAAVDWWPRRGPAWDAVALARQGDGDASVVLFEAKANIPEFTAGNFAGTHPDSIRMIHTAPATTQTTLAATAPLAVWTGNHYQLANRLAWTAWLRAHDVDAHFAYLLFHDDRSHIPTSQADLRARVADGYTQLGIESARWPWLAAIDLPALR